MQIIGQVFGDKEFGLYHTCKGKPLKGFKQESDMNSFTFLKVSQAATWKWILGGQGECTKTGQKVTNVAWLIGGGGLGWIHLEANEA